MTTLNIHILEHGSYVDLTCLEDEMAKQLLERLGNDTILSGLELNAHDFLLPSTAFAELLFPCLVKQVQDLKFYNIVFDDDLVTILGQALSQNETTTTTRHLTALSIKISGTLSAHAGFELAKGLSNNPQISTLHLSSPEHDDTDILDYGGAFHHLCGSLPNLTSLTDLYIHLNLSSYNNDPPLHPTPAEAFMLAITNHPTLSYLTLINSSDVGFYGIKTIARRFGNRNIKIKSLSFLRVFENIASAKEEAKTQMELDSIGEDLVKSLKSNIYLITLFFPGVYKYHPGKWVKISPKIMDCITFFIDLNKKGRRFLCDSSFSDVPPSLWCNFLAGCGNNSSLFFGLLHEVTPNGNLLLIEILCR